MRSSAVYLILLGSLTAVSPAGAIDLAAPREGLIEKPPFIQSVKDVLPTELIEKRGIYRVEHRVVSDGFLNTYSVSSFVNDRQGPVAVRGGSVLREYIHELGALRELRDKSTAGVVLNATGKAGIEILTAPGRAIGSLISAVRDPEGTWKTVKEVPSGVVGLFEYAGEETAKAYGSAKKAVVGESKERGAARESLRSKAESEAEAYALRWAGYSSAEKELYAKLGVDPYTQNEQLRSEIRRVAGAESAVNIAAKFVPGVGGLALVGDINKVLKVSREIATFSDPRKLKEKQSAQLVDAGYGASVVRDLFANSSVSPTQLTMAAETLLALAPIRGSSGVARRLAGAKSRESFIALLEAAGYLARLHRIKPLQELLAGYGVPIGLTVERSLIVPLPVDSVFFTPPFAKNWNGVLAEAKRRGVASIEVRLRGKASPALEAALDRDGIYLFEGVEI